MMANNDMSRWCVLYTAAKSERKLVQRLHAAGYMAFCPMQIVFKKWKGQTKEVNVAFLCREALFFNQTNS